MVNWTVINTSDNPFDTFVLTAIKDTFSAAAEKAAVEIRFYELVALRMQGNDKLCLMTIARWSHSFPSRTGQ
jgi:hypothetical protein